MKKTAIITLTLIFVLCFPAYAYLDPGMYFLQIIIATLLGSICGQLKPKEVLICNASS